jgi:small subunit ribosomal protein S20
VANIKSQIKRNKTNEKRRLRNRTVRAELRTRTKSALAAVETGAENADATVGLAMKKIDNAATKGVIHPNAAARRKSRLMKQLNRTKAQAEA